MTCPLSWWRVNVPVTPGTGRLFWLFLAIIRILAGVAGEVVALEDEEDLLSIDDEVLAMEEEVVILSLVD